MTAAKDDHDRVVDVDDEQAVEVVDRIDHEVRRRVGGERERRDIHAALATDDVRIARHDADGHQSFEPGGQFQPAFAVITDEIATLRHAASIG